MAAISPSVHLSREPGFICFNLFTVTGRLLLDPPLQAKEVQFPQTPPTGEVL